MVGLQGVDEGVDKSMMGFEITMQIPPAFRSSVMRITRFVFARFSDTVVQPELASHRHLHRGAGQRADRPGSGREVRR